MRGRAVQTLPCSVPPDLHLPPPISSCACPDRNKSAVSFGLKFRLFSMRDSWKTRLFGALETLSCVRLRAKNKTGWILLELSQGILQLRNSPAHGRQRLIHRFRFDRAKNGVQLMGGR